MLKPLRYSYWSPVDVLYLDGATDRELRNPQGNSLNDNEHLFSTCHRSSISHCSWELKKQKTESVMPRKLLCHLKTTLPTCTKGHRIIASDRGRSSAQQTGSQGLWFQPTQHFLANNLCNTCRTIQPHTGCCVWLHSQTRCNMQQMSQKKSQRMGGFNKRLLFGPILVPGSFFFSFKSPACLHVKMTFNVISLWGNIIGLYCVFVQ